jgi:hypothetical protein
MLEIGEEERRMGFIVSVIIADREIKVNTP